MTSVAFCDNTQQITSGGLDNDIKIWDLRKNELLGMLNGHTDTVTGLAVSVDNSYLLSNGMDHTGQSVTHLLVAIECFPICFHSAPPFYHSAPVSYTHLTLPTNREV